jgi:hypothetical protein
MKRVLSVIIVSVFAFASACFAADDAAKVAPGAGAAAEVTKGVAGVAEKGMERRGGRRAARREALFGGDKASKGTKDVKKEEQATKKEVVNAAKTATPAAK